MRESLTALSHEVDAPVEAFREMNTKRQAVLERIESLERAIRRATEYLETGKHADWHGFKPLFSPRRPGNKEPPPHRDWVRNVFLPRMEKALHRSEKVLERLG